MKKKLIFIFCLFILTHSARADEFDVLYERLFTDLIASNLAAPADIQKTLDLMTNNGNFTDLDYRSSTFIPSWRPVNHFFRLLDMALAYKKEVSGNTFYQSAVLKDRIKQGLLYWYNLNPQPVSDNWYDNDIRKKQLIAKILLLMKNEYAHSDYANLITAGCRKYLILPDNYETTDYKNTLANCQMINELLIYHGVIEKNQVVMEQGITNMIGIIEIQPAFSMGLQRDGTFQVHGLQIYNPGYGLSMTDGISYWAEKTSGLSKTFFTQAHLDLVRVQLLEGDQWMLYGSAYDFNTDGRQITSSGYNNATSVMKKVCKRMMVADPDNAADYQLMYTHINSGGSLAGVVGNKHFYRGDFMTHRRAGKYIGVKMCSGRTVGTEGMNSENLKAFWLPMGSTCIFTKANEYKDVFGYWDWSKIPGVTNPAVEFTWPLLTGVMQTQSQTFVGGVSDGTYGAAAMILKTDSLKNRVRVDIQAHKAWFMFDDEMVALGSDITSSYAAAVTTTTLNQSKKNGTVYVNGKGVSATDTKLYPNVTNIHHDYTGYVFRVPTDVYMKSNTQSGNWNDISKSRPNATVSGGIFKLWLNHGAAPSGATYEYIVLPNKTAAQTGAYAQNIPLEITNTSTVQAVTHTDLKITQVVFYSAGSLAIEGGPVVSVTVPCMLLIDHRADPIKITAADPTQIRFNLTVRVDYQNGQSEPILLPLPMGAMAGSSVTKSGTITTAIHEEEISETKVYPNPSNGQFNVQSGSTIKSLELFNLQGQKVSELSNVNSHSVDVQWGSRCSAGIYILRISYYNRAEEKVTVILK